MAQDCSKCDCKKSTYLGMIKKYGFKACSICCSNDNFSRIVKGLFNFADIDEVYGFKKEKEQFQDKIEKLNQQLGDAEQHIVKKDQTILDLNKQLKILKGGSHEKQILLDVINQGNFLKLFEKEIAKESIGSVVTRTLAYYIHQYNKFLIKIEDKYQQLHKYVQIAVQKTLCQVQWEVVKIISGATEEVTEKLYLERKDVQGILEKSQKYRNQVKSEMVSIKTVSFQVENVITKMEKGKEHEKQSSLFAYNDSEVSAVMKILEENIEKSKQKEQCLEDLIIRGKKLLSSIEQEKLFSNFDDLFVFEETQGFHRDQR